MIAAKIYGPCEMSVGHMCGPGWGAPILCGVTAAQLYRGTPTCDACAARLKKRDDELQKSIVLKFPSTQT